MKIDYLIYFFMDLLELEKQAPFLVLIFNKYYIRFYFMIWLINSFKISMRERTVYTPAIQFHGE
jgi:hypothetical protein